MKDAAGKRPDYRCRAMSRALAAFALASIAAVAQATTLVALDTQDLVAQAKVVAVVDVVATRVARSGGILTTVATLEVVRAVKGTALGERLVAFSPGGRQGEWVQLVDGAPRLQEGETRVVFLEPAGPGVYRFVGLEQGALRVVPDRSAPGGFAVERHFVSRLVPKHSGLPLPLLPSREPLMPYLAKLDHLAGARR